MYVRGTEEVEYQRRAQNILPVIYDNAKRGIEFRSVSDIPNLLPRPITDWYMFADRESWEEDSDFERRQRAPKQERSGGKVVWKGGLLLSWNEVYCFNTVSYTHLTLPTILLV